MFSNDNLLCSQIGFYRALLKLFESESLNEKKQSILDVLLKADREFSEQFDYLISDMNSHARHLFFYFKATLILAFKRRFGFENKCRLSGEPLNEFNKLFEIILDRFEMNEIEKESARSFIDDKDLESKFFETSNNFDFYELDKFFNKLADKNSF